jgi:hypothetical protein
MATRAMMLSAVISEATAGANAQIVRGSKESRTTANTHDPGQRWRIFLAPSVAKERGVIDANMNFSSMHPSTQSSYERSLSILAGIFILTYFWVFSYDGLHAFFTYDDGMALVALHGVFKTPFWKNILEVLEVFTKAFRPAGSIFWRGLYAVFGFDPLPYRIIIHLMLVMNIALVYILARRLALTKEAAALSALIFSYNGSMVDLYYNTSTIYDVLCCTFYVSALMVYVRGRSTGNPLSTGRIAGVVLLYLAALDTKEIAVTLPAVLAIYELIYNFRDLKSRAIVQRSAGLFAAMFVMAAIYSKVKVTNMGQNDAYTPKASTQFILGGFARCLQQLTLRNPDAFTMAKAGTVAGVLLAATALIRTRAAFFGLLYMTVALIPVAIIAPRGGYASYVAYPGLALAVGSLLAEARSRLIRLARKPQADLASAVILFLLSAGVLAYLNAHARKESMGNQTWDQAKRVDFMAGLKRTIPEFPPNARVIVTEDPWGPDWGPMFLTILKYHDKDLWLDRLKNMDKPPDFTTYDALIKYKEPSLDIVPATFLGLKMKWEVRFPIAHPGEFTISSANPAWQGKNIVFSPNAARIGQQVTMTAPGLANVKLNAVYRIVSGGQSTTHTVMNWCTLDANGTCTMTAPPAGSVGTLVVDWIQPENQRWIFTTGILTVVE